MGPTTSPYLRHSSHLKLIFSTQWEYISGTNAYGVKTLPLWMILNTFELYDKDIPVNVIRCMFKSSPQNAAMFKGWLLSSKLLVYIFGQRWYSLYLSMFKGWLFFSSFIKKNWCKVNVSIFFWSSSLTNREIHLKGE
jgi:hypothetical protein